MPLLDSVIVTRASRGRVISLRSSGRRRVAKKWTDALAIHPAAGSSAKCVRNTIDNLRLLYRHGVRLTRRAEKQVARLLRHSGLKVVVALPGYAGQPQPIPIPVSTTAANDSR